MLIACLTLCVGTSDQSDIMAHRFRNVGVFPLRKAMGLEVCGPGSLGGDSFGTGHADHSPVEE